MTPVAPVLLITFNRPDTTKQVFAAIREAKPKQLFIASDGAREHKSGEAERVAEVRALVSAVDWDCEVQTLFRDHNLGCKYGVAGAIDWFFQHVEAGIILEDDCLPHPDFFRFTSEMLEHYKDDNRIMMISGDNFQQGQKRGDGSYFFSRIPHIWGWATWRRAWSLFDLEMKSYPEFKAEHKIATLFPNTDVQNMWSTLFDDAMAGRDTWDYQWNYAILTRRGLCINPNVNLISNIGFTPSATHTHEPTHLANLPTKPIGEIKHPSKFAPDEAAETQTLRYVFGVTSVDGNIFMQYLKKLWRKINRAASAVTQ